MLLHLKESDYNNEVLKSNVPVLVDFSAVWCGPCKMMGPVMEQMAAKYEGRAKIAKVDIDESSSLAAKYNILSVPSLLFFKNGQLIDQVVGAVPAAMLEEKLNSLL